jgi:hypothetical protein
MSLAASHLTCWWLVPQQWCVIFNQIYVKNQALMGQWRFKKK